MSALNYCYVMEKSNVPHELDGSGIIVEYITMDKAHIFLHSHLGVIKEDQQYYLKFQEVKNNVLRAIQLIIENNPYCLITDDLQKLKCYEQNLMDQEVHKETIDEILNSLVEVFRKYSEE